MVADGMAWTAQTLSTRLVHVGSIISFISENWGEQPPLFLFEPGRDSSLSLMSDPPAVYAVRTES